jgi:hypothetical protein
MGADERNSSAVWALLAEKGIAITHPSTIEFDCEIQDLLSRRGELHLQKGRTRVSPAETVSKSIWEMRC